MNKKIKFLGVFILVLVLGIIIMPKDILAYTTKGVRMYGDNPADNYNLITLPWHPGTPNLYWRFSFTETDQTVYCIEPHVVFNGGQTYNGLGKYAGDIGRQMSYVYDSNPPVGTWQEAGQVKQAVIWALNGDYDIYSLDRNNPYVNIAIALYEESKNNFNGADITNQMSVHELTYNLEGNNWVSNWIYIKPGTAVWNNIGGLQRDGDNWRLVVDNNTLTGPVIAEIYSSMTTTRYNEADMFGGPNATSTHGQNVVIGGGSYQDTASETASGSIIPVGNLLIEKKDNHENYKANAKFHVSGPGYEGDVVTNEYGQAWLNNIAIGDYVITELEAPNNMINQDEGKVCTVTVYAAQTITYTRVNPYQRGSVRLKKYNVDNREANSGNASLKGAIYELYSGSENIYEGPTLIYKANTLVKGNIVTDENGDTEAVTDLPIGDYYYKEIKASPGFNINPDLIPVKIVYAGQDVDVAAEAYNEAPEKQMYNDLVITKFRGQTANTQKSPISGAVFTARLDSDPTKEYVSTVTDENGYCIIKDMPYGHYTIEETIVPNTTLKCSDFKLFVQRDKSQGIYTLDEVEFVDKTNKLDTVGKQWLDEEGNLIDEPKVMHIKIRKVDKDGWEGKEKVDFTQGDAVLKGAVYSIYEWNDATNSYSSEPIKNITVDHKDEEGYWCAEQDNLIVGKKYMIKEKVKYTDTVNGVTYKYSFAEGYLVDETEFEFYQQPETQTTKRTYHTEVSKEEVERGRISVIKYDNQDLSSTESPAKGAILRLTLDKDKSVYYDVRIDDKGYGEFIDRNDADGSHASSITTCYGAKYYPYTIPYGKYTITEIKASDKNEHTSYYIQPVSRTIDKQAKDIYNTILADEPIKIRLKVVKKDADTKQNITNNSAVFQIYDCQNKEMLKFMTMEGEKDRLQTNEEGWFYTPQELLSGKYILYEIDSPDAYYLDPKLNLPEDNNEVTGVEIDLNKIIEAEVTDKNNPIEYVHTIVMENQVLKGKVEVLKQGEMLTGYKTEKVTGLDGEIYTVTKPVYEYKALEGVEYTLTAKEDIKSPDGVIWEAKGTTHVIETNAEGYAVTEELYCGTYAVTETKTPKGFKTDTNIPDVVVTNTYKNERVKTISKEYKNQKMPTQIDVEKVLAEDEYDLSENKVGVILGIYANEEIKNYNQEEILIKKGTLLDVVEGRIEAGEKMTLTSNVNLPEGKYYVKEIYVDYPYTVDVNEKGFEVRFDSTKTDKVLVNGIVINNDINTVGSLGLIKLSTSLFKGDLNSKVGGFLSDKEVEEEEQKLKEWVNKESFDTVVKVLRGEETPSDLDIARYRLDSKYKLYEATYELYKDKELTKPLTKNGQVVSFTTDSNGIGKIENLPVGEYYLKEIKAPKMIFDGEEFEYDKELGEIKIELSIMDTDRNVARVLFDDVSVGVTVTKTDFFTGEVVPNCRFEIRNSKDELIVDATTNSKGIFQMPLDLFVEGETYTYTELDAPEEYNIDPTPHEFTVELDENGKPIPVEVENIRITKALQVIKKDADTGKLLPGCVFTIVMLDENGNPKIDPRTGKIIYIAQNEVTDENGQWYKEDVPVGTYRFEEIKAPEGYELDEDLTGYTFTISKDSPELTIFEVTNTGDIAVIAISAVFILSAIGIIATILKRKNIN